MAALLSFVVCSITSAKLEKLKRRLAVCMRVDYEVIAITDAKSLCEGYTRGFTQTQGDYVVFCHDDIDFFCETDLYGTLIRHLQEFDVVGVAGTTKMSGPLWMSSGPACWAGMVIHHAPESTYNLTIYDCANSPTLAVQALDGVFLAMRREVVETIGFDQETFDGFHSYDIDFTYRCHLAGYRLAACKDLFLVHESSGNFGSEWRKYGERFIRKHAEFAHNPLELSIRYSPCSILASTEEEARLLCKELTQGFIDPALHTGSQKISASAQEYAQWLSRKSLQEIDGQVLAERMMKKWTTRPFINIAIEVRQGEENLLADTIDSLATQWYPDWHLTIQAAFAPFSDELSQEPQITWITVDEATCTPLTESVAKSNANWVCILEAGTTLEPHALAYFADTINLRKGIELIYCDEDVVTDTAATASPRFKPKFNLEFLRSTYYLGPVLLISRQSFIRNGGLQRCGTPGLYELSLKVFESHGEQGFEHIPEILVHTPAQPLREMEAEQEREVLHEHLGRLGTAAVIEEGFLQGTQAVRYIANTAPTVSIITLTRDQPGYLEHCIESLLKETHYRHFELIVVDHGTNDPDALDYLGNLQERCQAANISATCLRTDGQFSYARLANLGAQSAKGDYLLFIDNDTEIIQPEWLDWLIGYAIQPAVAAVAPRLSTPNSNFAKVNGTPRILGLAGLAGNAADENSNLIAPGYCGRLQIAQDTSALHGSCLLVKASIFHELDGFNEKDTPVYETTLELCLRLRQHNYRLIWTPWVDIAHHGGISRNKLESDPNERAWLTDITLKERDFLLDRYLPLLAHDPNYHRQLSLLKPFYIEPYAVIDWDTRFHDRLRILGAPLTSGSGEYRMVSPFRALQKEGLAQCCQIYPMGHKTQRVINPIELARAAPDVLMLQQAIDDVQIGQLKRYRRFNPEIFITYAVDDVLGNLPRKHYLYNFQAREGRSRMREGLAHCDRLIVSTEPLAEYCRSMIGDIVVVPNRLEKSLWLGHESKRGAGKKPRVGWAGAQQHLGDLELIKEVVETLHDEVEWIFMGMCPPFLKPYVTEEHPFVSFEDYPAKLASLNLDLALAPLEQHLFNEGKSNLRLLEYGIMGWPVICTDIYPYQTNNPPVKRLPNSAQLWIEAIRERINDLEATYLEGEALRAWVHEHYLLEDHLEDWLSAITPPNWKLR